MAKRSNKRIDLLPLGTIIEVVAKHDKKIIKQKMKYGEWLNLKKKPGWSYSAYQEGFCSIKESKQ